MIESKPTSAEELALILKQAADAGHTIYARGSGSKDAMGGPVLPADLLIATTGMRRVLKYEPRDLTISVEAGLPFSDLQTLLAKNQQMIALDPAALPGATVGGVIASNVSGPMRLGFGTARDLVIGMTFATVNGRVIKAGGMVVKNVAGLDLGKLMIGSFGTLGVISSVNFRVHSLPPQTGTFLFSFRSAGACVDKLRSLAQSKLRPQAIDLLSPGVAQQSEYPEYLLAVRAAGSTAVLNRYARELAPADHISGAAERRLWERIGRFSADFTAANPDGVVLRVSTRMAELEKVIGISPGACVSRAAAGISYLYLSSWQDADVIWRAAEEHHWGVAVEFAPAKIRAEGPLWRIPGSAPAQSAFDMMKKLKQSFDPKNLLNRARLYGRI